MLTSWHRAGFIALLCAACVAISAHTVGAAPYYVTVAGLGGEPDYEQRFTALAKDLDKCMSYYADDAIFISSGVPAAVGKDNIRKNIQDLLSIPGMQLNITVASVDVARSGDLAMDRGTVQATVTDKKGQSVTTTSDYVLVWKKMTDGSWKIEADTSANEKLPQRQATRRPARRKRRR